MAGSGARDIKRRIKSVNSTKQITKAMELVSTAKLRRSKKTLEETKPFFSKVMATVQHILANEKGLNHVYLEQRDVKRSLYIVITADRGLAGGYNINAVKAAAADFTSKDAVGVITVGKYANEYFRREGVENFDAHLGISEKPTYDDAKRIASRALSLYKSGDVDEIKLVYTELVSTIEQEPKLVQLLPVVAPDVEIPEDDASDEPIELMAYAPSPEEVLDYLIPKYIESTIFGALVESAASEQAARRTAMENATDNAEEMIDSLTLSFNQARQAAITQEISEIVGGATAFE